MLCKMLLFKLLFEISLMSMEREVLSLGLRIKPKENICYL